MLFDAANWHCLLTNFSVQQTDTRHNNHSRTAAARHTAVHRGTAYSTTKTFNKLPQLESQG